MYNARNRNTELEWYYNVDDDVALVVLDVLDILDVLHVLDVNGDVVVNVLPRSEYLLAVIV